MSINSIKTPDMAPPGMIGPRISRASRAIRWRFNRVVNEEGLFSGQHHIILFLKHNSGVTLSQLANELNITTATASVSIKRMEKAGFIKKQEREDDARIKTLFLTEKGMTVTENIREKMDSQEDKLTKGLTDDEIMLLSDLLDKVIDNMEKEEWYND